MQNFFKGSERTDFENGWGVRQSDFGKQKNKKQTNTKTKNKKTPTNRQNHSSCGWMGVGDNC